MNKLGFIIFHEYFDEKYKECAASEFFDRWSKLLSHCVPINQPNNQMTLLDIVHKCWKVAKKDNHPKATQTCMLFRL